jgi:glycosyltransferase involved in cell wall biosynthesis
MTAAQAPHPKVLHIATAFPPDEQSAITPWLAHLLMAQRRLGLDAQVLTSAFHGLGDGAVHGIPVRRFRYAPAAIENLTHEMAIYEKLRRQPARYAQVPVFLLAGWLKARRLRPLRPDIVHVHWPIPLGLLSLPFSDARLVFHYHQTELSLVRKFPWLKRLFRRVIERADIHLCNSSYTRERLRELFGEVPAEVVPMPFAWEVPAELPPKEAGRILFVGRMVSWKGGDLLIHACEALQKRGLSCKLILVGEGPERQSWQDLAQRLDINAEFAGWKIRSELMNEYARASVVVLPSRYDHRVWVESLGVVLLEAMACGTAVIASRIGGPLDIVHEEQNGLLFDPFNVEDLAAKVSRLVADPALARKMGEAGRSVAAAYSPDAIAGRLSDIYRRLLSGGAP